MSETQSDLQEICEGIFKVLPSKITPSKYVSFFVPRTNGNLLFPCLSSSSTFESSWESIHDLGGIAHQLLGDMHFATKHNDTLFEEFGAPTRCSELEHPDVNRKVENVEPFPFQRHEVVPGVTVIPTPGHRPGAVAYLLEAGPHQAMFIGDSIWYDGKSWVALASKKNRRIMNETLSTLKKESFSLLITNGSVKYKTCSIELPTLREKDDFLDQLIQT